MRGDILYIWYKTKTAYHKEIIPTVRHDSGSMVDGSCSVLSRPGQVTFIDGTKNSLPEDPEGECRIIGLSIPIIQRTPASPFQVWIVA